MHSLTRTLDRLLRQLDFALHPFRTPRTVTDGYPPDLRRDLSPVVYCGNIADLPAEVAELFDFGPLRADSDAYLIYEDVMVEQCAHATDPRHVIMFELAARAAWEKLRYRLHPVQGDYSTTVLLTATDIWRAAGSPHDKPRWEVEVALRTMAAQLSQFKLYYLQTMRIAPTDPRADTIATWRVKCAAETHVLGTIGRIFASENGETAARDFVQSCAELAEAKVKH